MYRNSKNFRVPFFFKDILVLGCPNYDFTILTKCLPVYVSEAAPEFARRVTMMSPTKGQNEFVHGMHIYCPCNR